MRAVVECKPVLVVVDVQNGFVTEDSARVVPVIVDLVRRWQSAGGHTIFTRYFNFPNSPFERLIGWYGLHQPPDTDLVDDLASFTSQPNAHVIDKTVYTALTPECCDLIREAKFTDLMICGIATDGCVLKTTLDAFEAGYTPWVLADAVASNATSTAPEEVHRAGLLLASRLVGAQQIITSEEALAKLPIACPAAAGDAAG